MTEEEQIRAEIEAEMRIQAAEEAKIRLQIEEEMRIEAKRQAEERLRQEVPNLIKAADEGDMESQAKVGENYDGGKCYFPSDISKAFHYTKLAAEQGHSEAQNKLAHWYREGYGFTVDKDPQKAFEWFKKSAEQGHSNSIAYLGGWCYLEGNGTDKDLLLAATWLERALDLGMTDNWTKQRSHDVINMFREEISFTEQALTTLAKLPNTSTSLFAEGEITIIPCYRAKEDAANTLETKLKK